jgi:hypothetical protein
VRGLVAHAREFRDLSARIPGACDYSLFHDKNRIGG